MLLAPLIWVVTAAVAYVFWLEKWWFPPPISAFARDFDAKFSLTVTIIGALFLLSQTLLGLLLLRKSGRRSSGNPRLELLWTLATATIFLGLGFASTRTWATNLLSPEPANALKVEVFAKQFAWSYRYPGADGKFGRTAPRFINDAAANPFGIDESDPAGKDDIVTAVLRVPAGRPVALRMRSRDVIHSFFARELRLKQDLVPGMEIPLYFQADKPGTYELACAELCGLGHHQMRSRLIVMTPGDFEEWLQEEGRR